MLFQGFYFDGEDAQRHQVTVTLAAEMLVIQGSRGGELARWPYAALEPLEEVYPGRPARLFQKGAPGALLTVTDPAFLDQLERRSGRSFRPGAFWKPSLRTAAVTALALAVGVAGFALALPYLAGPLAGLVPAAWERALGQKVLQQVAPQNLVCATPQGDAALAELTARLLQGEPGAGAVRVRVVRRPAVNAFALPGGEIVLLEGLLHQARSGEEVAGVLAHEIAHSLQRHPLKGLLRAVGVRLLFAALLGDATALEAPASNLGQVLLALSFGRENERAADRLGLRLLNRADIRGDGLVSFFQRLGAAGGPGEPPALLSSHPLPRERAALVQATATGRGAALAPGKWAALRAICRQG